jgi:hypothetical protein
MEGGRSHGVGGGGAVRRAWSRRERERRAAGPGAETAIQSLLELIERKFDEE